MVLYNSANVLRVDDEAIERLEENLIVYRLCIQSRIGDAVLTSFAEAQENVIDVLPLDTVVIPRQILPVF